jgi:hypothetical protein
MNDTYDVYDTDNLDNAYENTLIREPAHSSSFVRNPGSFRSQGGSTYIRPTIPTPTLPEGCKCEACLAAKAAHEPPPPSVSTADVMKQLEDLKKFMVEQMKPPTPVAPPVPVTPLEAVPVPVSAYEPAARLPKIVYSETSTNQTQYLTGNPEITIKKVEPVVEAPAATVAETHELEEIRALLAERQKDPLSPKVDN